MDLSNLQPWKFTLEPGEGYWTPILWLIVIAVAFLVVYLIRSFGRKDFNATKGKTQSFLSGNPEYEKEKMHIPSKNLYWGFLESMKWIYDGLNKMHNGFVGDYILWFVVVMGILFICVIMAGGI
jgi:hypothetical protein